MYALPLPRPVCALLLLAALALAGGCTTTPSVDAGSDEGVPGGLTLPAGDSGRVHVGGELRMGVEFGR